jgi:hypothetical protein
MYGARIRWLKVPHIEFEPIEAVESPVINRAWWRAALGCWDKHARESEGAELKGTCVQPSGVDAHNTIIVAA